MDYSSTYLTIIGIFMFSVSSHFIFFSEINSVCQGLNKTNILLFKTFFSYFVKFYCVYIYFSCFILYFVYLNLLLFCRIFVQCESALHKTAPLYFLCCQLFHCFSPLFFIMSLFELVLLFFSQLLELNTYLFFPSFFPDKCI